MKGSNRTQMKLYRGDSIPNQVLSADPSSRGKTFPEHFCDNGLMAKHSSGHPTLLAGKDLRQLVEEHVGYTKGSQAEKLYLHSPMLSFSSSNECAFGYSERRSKKRIRPKKCTFWDATHFLWELQIDLPDPKEPGLYQFQYYSDPQHCREIVAPQFQKGNEIEAKTGDFHVLATAIGAELAARGADSDRKIHFACLIDVNEFIKEDRGSSDPQILALARQRAERDKEWLLYPSDAMPNGHGLSSRFFMNKDLRVSAYYRLS